MGQLIFATTLTFSQEEKILAELPPEVATKVRAILQPGDSRLIWDSRNQDEVASAKVMYESLKKKGFLAYGVTGKGDKGEVIKEFDPGAEKIIMAPPMRGGR